MMMMTMMMSMGMRTEPIHDYGKAKTRERLRRMTLNLNLTTEQCLVLTTSGHSVANFVQCTYKVMSSPPKFCGSDVEDIRTCSSWEPRLLPRSSN